MKKIFTKISLLCIGLMLCAGNAWGQYGASSLDYNNKVLTITQMCDAGQTPQWKSQLQAMSASPMWAMFAPTKIVIEKEIASIVAQSLSGDILSTINTIEFKSSTPPTLANGTNVFNSGWTIIVPDGAECAYKEMQHYTTYFPSLNNVECSLQPIVDLSNPIVVDGITYQVDVEHSNATVLGCGGCSGSVIIPASIANPNNVNQSFPVVAIDAQAFENNTGITSCTIGDNVANIGNYAFRGCSSLSTINVSRNTPATLGTDVFDGLPENFRIYVAVALYPNSAKSRANTYRAAAGWSAYATNDIDSPIRSNQGGNSETSWLNDNYNTVFSYNNSTIEASVSEWQGSDNVTEITIPAKIQNMYGDWFALTSIGSGAYQDSRCPNLEKVIFESMTPPALSNASNVFANKGNLSIEYPEGAEDDYNSAEYYGVYFANIQANYPNGSTVDEHFMYQLVGGAEPYAIVVAPDFWYDYLPDGATGAVSIPAEIVYESYTYPVKQIAANALNTYVGITSLTLPASIETIGDNAMPTMVNDFMTMSDTYSSLVSFNVDANNIYFKSVNGVLFDKAGETLIACPSRKSGIYYVPDGVQSIRNYAFAYCTELTGIAIPYSVSSIGLMAFYNCTSLANMSIASTALTISNFAFLLCNSVSYVLINVPAAIISDQDLIDRGIPNTATIARVKSSVLEDSESAVAVIETLLEAGEERDITANRPVQLSNQYNTLCLPFSMDENQIAESSLVGAEIYEFANAAKNGEYLDFHFRPVTTITAGIPYFIRYPQDGTPLTSLDFEDVTVTTATAGSVTHGDVTLIGTLSQVSISGADKLYLAANNTLYYSNSPKTIKPFRAYFSVAGVGPNYAPKARIVQRENTTTDIESVVSEDKTIKFLENGQILIKRGESVYNLQGQIIK